MHAAGYTHNKEREIKVLIRCEGRGAWRLFRVRSGLSSLVTAVSVPPTLLHGACKCYLGSHPRTHISGPAVLFPPDGLPSYNACICVYVCECMHVCARGSVCVCACVFV